MIVRYLLKTLVMPPASNLLLMLLGVCLWRVYPRLAKGCIVLGIVSLWLLSTPWFAFQLISPLEHRWPPLAPSQDCGDAGAIVVLGGGLYRYAPEYSDSGDVSPPSLSRLRYAATLARRCNLPVAISGGGVFKRQAKSEAELMASVLENEFRVPVRWREMESRNTAENAALTVPLLLREGISTIILVTSASHMPRSVSSFSRESIAVIAAPTVFTVRPGGLIRWLPLVKALQRSQIALHEYLGMLVYKTLY